jgi:hypothetical protein
MVTFEEAGFIYGIEFDSVTGNLALYSPINEDVLEPVS